MAAETRGPTIVIEITDETSDRITNSEASRATAPPASSPISRCARVMREVSSRSQPDQPFARQVGHEDPVHGQVHDRDQAVPISMARGTVRRGSRNSSAA